MLLKLARKFLTLAVALAFIAPPLGGVLDKALGGDGSHIHFDHFWHEVGDTDHHHRDQMNHVESGPSQNEDSAQTHNDHVHLTAVALAESFSMSLDKVPTTYEGLSPRNHIGQQSEPLGRPPQIIS